MEKKTFWDFIEEMSKHDPMKLIKHSGLVGKVMELEALDRWFNMMLGVNLEITVTPAERNEGRFYRKGLGDLI